MMDATTIQLFDTISTNALLGFLLWSVLKRNSNSSKANGVNNADIPLIKSDIHEIKSDMKTVRKESSELHETHLGLSGMDENNEAAWKNNTKLSGERHSAVVVGLESIRKAVKTLEPILHRIAGK